MIPPGTILKLRFLAFPCFVLEPNGLVLRAQAEGLGTRRPQVSTRKGSFIFIPGLMMGRMAILLVSLTAMGLSGSGFDEKPVAAHQDAKPAPNNVQMQRFEQQFTPLFRQLYRSELHFMRLACQPTKAQFEKISAESEAALKEATKNFARRIYDYKVARNRSQGVAFSDPQVSIAESLAKSVRRTLSPEQAARYRKELDLRTEAQKQALVPNLVAKVDDVLFLTAEQRTKLAKVLEEHWNDAMNQPQLFLGRNIDFPPMPDAEILPLLTEAQKTVWRGVAKEEGFLGYGIGIIRGIELGDEVWDKERATASSAAGKAAVKNEATPKAVEKK
jgi:hypothetical protein